MATTRGRLTVAIVQQGQALKQARAAVARRGRVPEQTGTANQAPGESLPKTLCYLMDVGDGHVRWQPLPPDLDRLFRASPKLAEACADVREDLRGLLANIKGFPHAPVDTIKAQLLLSVGKLYDALVLLEQKPCPTSAI